ncbi:hypothetical protein CLONEX_03461 [[Clostridium] nexile DSM 1787]|nr:hypothetical protein CLONEX_03461 [[Clostridium] nexile DSM 1787]
MEYTKELIHDTLISIKAIFENGRKENRMNGTKDAEKESFLTLEEENLEEQDVEGYSRCTTHKQRCLTDCLGWGALISSLD